MLALAVRRKLACLSRRWREARLFARAMTCPLTPIVAHLVPTRRCNLACAYCNEYDGGSAPIALPELLRRVDRLAELGASAITLSGGEPLLHPEVVELVAHIRRRGMLAGVLTNGFLLNADLIERLNRAGLDYLQVSLDNLMPDAVSRKSWNLLQRQLGQLASGAVFAVNINLVLGTGISRPEEALEIFRRARRLGFHATLGLAHDSRGQLAGLSAREREVYEELIRLSPAGFADFAAWRQFQRNLIEGRPNQWHCPAGCLYLYVCEDGLVHYCSQQRGRPGLPLLSYSRQDLEREYHRPKPCAPFCTISCVHQIAMLERLRRQPREALAEWFPGGSRGEPAPPAGVRLLRELFLPARFGGRHPRLTRWLTRAALRLLGLR